MRRILPVVVGVVFLVVLLYGCHGKTPVSSGTIVFLGDSITAGYGLDPNQAYPSLIDIPGMRMLNLGVVGSTSADGLQRLKDCFAVGAAPRLVVIALGANDILHGVPAETTEANLGSAIAECKSRRIPVLLCGVAIPGRFGTDGIFTDVSNRNHIPLMKDLLQGEAFHEDMMQEDHMHPTAAGQKIIAGAMQTMLLKHFSFKTGPVPP